MVLAVLGLIVGLVIASMVRGRKKGKCSGCAGCSLAGSCGQSSQMRKIP